MKALPTQFSSGQFSGAVATPTCSSCCCCCCCVATTAVGSIVAARTVNREAKKYKIPAARRKYLATLAAWMPPLAVVGAFAVVIALQNLGEAPNILIIGGVALFWALAWAYSAIMRRATGVPKGFEGVVFAVLFTLAFTGEVFGSVQLLFSGEGGLAIYIFLVMVAISLAVTAPSLATKK